MTAAGVLENGFSLSNRRAAKPIIESDRVEGTAVYDHRGLTPEQYRQKWGLRPDYPMVAANYAKARSELAKAIGLGQKGKGRKRAAKKDSDE